MTNHARWFSGSHSRTSGGNTKRLLAIARQEVLRHAEIVLNPPDSSDFARQPRLTAAAGRTARRLLVSMQGGSGSWVSRRRENSDRAPDSGPDALLAGA